MKFVSSGQEKAFYTALEAYKQEFGPENIIIVIPKEWVGHIGYGKYYPCTVKIWDSDKVGIRVNNFSANIDI